MPSSLFMNPQLYLLRRMHEISIVALRRMHEISMHVIVAFYVALY